MTTTEAVNIYLKQIILICGLPFKVKLPKSSDDILEAIVEAEEIEKHPENYKSYINLGSSSIYLINNIEEEPILY